MGHYDRFLAGVCGKYCGTCDLYALGECRGCAYQLGLTKHGECAIFQCCIVEHGLEHCGLCDNFPCQIFSRSASQDAIQLRLEALSCRSQKGTDQWLAQEKRKPRNISGLNSEPENEH